MQGLTIKMNRRRRRPDIMTKSLGILPATFVVKARLMERTPLNTFDSDREGSPFLKCVVSITQ